MADAVKIDQRSDGGSGGGGHGGKELAEAAAIVGKLLEAFPHGAIHADDKQRHDNGGGCKFGKIGIVAGATDERAEAGGFIRFVFDRNDFRDDRRIPSAADRRDETGDQTGENRRQQEIPPALPALEAHDFGGGNNFIRNGGGGGRDVEEKVPLCAQ